MRDSEILKLSEAQIQKIERVNESIEHREDAIAKKESQMKFRILFERAASDTLPFIVYVLYMGYMGLFVLFKVLDYEGDKLYIASFLLFTIMVIPLFVLPINAWQGLKNWFTKKLIKQKNDGDLK